MRKEISGFEEPAGTHGQQGDPVLPGAKAVVSTHLLHQSNPDVLRAKERGTSSNTQFMRAEESVLAGREGSDRR